MKNVLLATSALVAMAGAASAEITLTGKANVEYNSLSGMTYTTAVDLGATTELNNGVTAGMSWGADLAAVAPFITFDNYPVVWIESSIGKMTAGQANKVKPASNHFKAGYGTTNFGAGSYVAANAAVRADASFGGFDVSVSEILSGGSDLRLGVSGSMGSVDFGLGYAMAGGAFGLNAGTTFGAFDVKASYFSGDGSYGVELGYDMGNGIELSAAYAAASWKVGAGYKSGAITAKLGYNSTGAVSLDGTYAINSDWKALAGYNSGTSDIYVGTTYDLGAGASVYAAYVQGTSLTNVGPEKWDNGITVGASLTF